MIPRFNLHTHTVFCDGKNTVDEMVLAAIELGCEGIGFSGHSYIEGQDWTIKKRGEDDYISEVLAAKKRYEGRIEVLLGVEYDTLSMFDVTPYDYVIGSVHFVVKGEERIPVDHTAENLRIAVDSYYGGDIYAFCEDYYEELKKVVKRTDCDIVGHFDLIMKFNENGDLFDVENPRYKKAALDALDALADKDVIFEINTGAISRGYRRYPYPSEFILRRMAELGCKVTVTTDCHSAEHLLCAYDEAIEYAASCGIKELYYPKDGVFVPCKI